MELPPLYKYLDVQGATLTLQNRTFKHAKPSTFNDIEDLTIRSIFPEDDETALKILQEGLVDVLARHLDEPSTTPVLTMRAKIALLQKIFNTHPEMVEVIKKQIASGEEPQTFTLEQMKSSQQQLCRRCESILAGLAYSLREHPERFGIDVVTVRAGPSGCRSQNCSQRGEGFQISEVCSRYLSRQKASAFRKCLRISGGESFWRSRRSYDKVAGHDHLFEDVVLASGE